MSVEGSCSAVFHSLHFGAWSIWQKECDAAIIGGSNAIYMPTFHVQQCDLGYISKDNNCAPFDESASGRLRAESCCVVILKPLQDALRFHFI